MDISVRVDNTCEPDYYQKLMDWIKKHHTTPFRMIEGSLDHNRLQFLAGQAVYWEKAYWALMYNELYEPRHMRMEKLNYEQASRIMELEFELKQIKRTKRIRIVGNTTYIEYKTGLELSKWIKDEET